jgi:predicted DNA-binding transcriptional regulator AlpA
MEDHSRAVTGNDSSQASFSTVLHAREAAKLVGLSESTLAKLRLNGNGPPYCKLGRRVVYRQDDLDRWLRSRTTTDTTDANARFLRALTVAHPHRCSAKTSKLGARENARARVASQRHA